MPDHASENSPHAARARPAAERRRNVALRELIDEMLASIRAAANRELWTAEERAQYERELAEIMTRVRAEAVRSRAEQGSGGAGA